MRFYFLLFITIYWLFLILAPLNAYAEDKIFTCKPVIAGYPQKDGKFYMEVEYQEPSSPLLDVIPTSQILIREEYVFYKNNPYRKDNAKQCSKIMGTSIYRIFDYPDQQLDTIAILEIIKELVLNIF